MSVHIKPEPGSPERGLPPPRPAAGSSRTRPYGDDDDLDIYEPETPRVPAKRGGGATGKRKTPASGPKKAAADKEWNYTYMPASTEQRKKNGRVEGRNLITWNRPRMAEKLLLHIMYECSRHRVDIPWDQVAHRLHPGSTGGAIVQHLNRLRGTLVAEGHLVPPICQKPGSRVVVDPHIRGYIRKFPDSEDVTTTREVRFDEPLEDRRFNLPDAWDTLRGNQIRYDAPSPGHKRPPATPTTPSTLPGLSTPPVPSSTAANRGTPAKRGRGGKKASSDRGIKREPSPDPAFLDSDEDYAPGPKPARKQARRSSRPTKPRVGSYAVDDEDEDELMEEEVLPKKIPRKRLQQQRATSNNRNTDDGYIEIDDDMTQASDASNSQSMMRPGQHEFLGGHNAYSLAEIQHAQRQQVQAHHVQLQNAAEIHRVAQLQHAAQMQAQLQRAQMQEALDMSYMSGVNINSSFRPSTSGGTSNSLARPLSIGDNNNGSSTNLSFDEHFSSSVGAGVSQGIGSVPSTPTGLRCSSRNPMLSEDTYSNHDDGFDIGVNTRSVSVSAQSNTNAVPTQGQSLGHGPAPVAAGSAEANGAQEGGDSTDGGNPTGTGTGTGTRAGSMESEDTGY